MKNALGNSEFVEKWTSAARKVYRTLSKKCLIENETDLGESAAGGLHKYANPSLIEQEKIAWRKAAINKHAEE